MFFFPPKDSTMFIFWRQPNFFFNCIAKIQRLAIYFCRGAHIVYCILQLGAASFQIFKYKFNSYCFSNMVVVAKWNTPAKKKNQNCPMSLPIFVRKCRSDHLHTRLYTSGAFFIVMMIKCQIFEPACWLNLFTQLNTISVEPCLYGYLYWWYVFVWLNGQHRQPRHLRIDFTNCIISPFFFSCTSSPGTQIASLCTSIFRCPV